jgi:DNA-binding response OmpR family regulator
MKVLIVDNDPHILRLLERMVRKTHYQAFTAGNASAALGVLQQEAIDIAVVDLPSGSGLELVKHIRQNFAERYIGVILLTAVLMAGSRRWNRV